MSTKKAIEILEEGIEVADEPENKILREVLVELQAVEPKDELFAEAAQIIFDAGRRTLLQKKLGVDYVQAKRIIKAMVEYLEKGGD